MNESKYSQEEERRSYLKQILESSASKKIIIAGPGTGKTFTFREMFKVQKKYNNLAMTFIRKLVAEMDENLSEYAEVKTLHAYCKKILHEQNYQVDLIPYLTEIVEKDALLLEKGLSDFNLKFQTLDEESAEVEFYLKRGDYYEAVSFNDSVYRLLDLLRKDDSIIPDFNLIAIDEFQDFNPLEVAFIDEIEKRGSILIVGDDDQSVYSGRSSSPIHLREKYRSGEYTTFELPFCNRCPKVIVEATNAFISEMQSLGGFSGRIERRFEPYLEGKEYENETYPRIITSKCTTLSTVIKYLHSEIGKIAPEDIAESYVEGEQYPTVLIVGQRHYLQTIEKKLSELIPNVNYVKSTKPQFDVGDAYEILLRNPRSNLGWRLLLEDHFTTDEQKELITQSEQGKPMVDFLNSEFVSKHIRIIEIIGIIKRNESLEDDVEKELSVLLGDKLKIIAERFSVSAESEDIVADNTKPSILLTSFLGCKGLSAGHVFIVGANNRSLPLINEKNEIEDIEISKFIVALTRTRKCCHIISNKWLHSPVNKNGEWIDPFEESTFIKLIPPKLIDDRGPLKSSDIK